MNRRLFLAALGASPLAGILPPRQPGPPPTYQYVLEEVLEPAVGAVDLYEIGPLINTPVTIHAVRVVAFARKTDATTRELFNRVDRLTRKA